MVFCIFFSPSTPPRDLVSLTHYFHCISWLYLDIAEQQLEWESESKVWIEYVHILRGSSRHKFALLTLLIDAWDCVVEVLRVVEWTWKVFQFCKISNEIFRFSFKFSSPPWLRTRCVIRGSMATTNLWWDMILCTFFSCHCCLANMHEQLANFNLAMLIVTGDVDDEEKSWK